MLISASQYSGNLLRLAEVTLVMSCIAYSLALPAQSVIVEPIKAIYQNVGLLCFDKYKGYVDLSYLCYSSQCVKIDEYDISVRVDRKTQTMRIESNIVVQNGGEIAFSNKASDQVSEADQKDAKKLSCGTDCNGLNRRFYINNLNLDKGKYDVFHGDKQLGAIYIEDEKGTLSKHICFGDDGINNKKQK